MDPLALALGAAGAVFGFLADRLATRWPEHDEEHPPGRALDWRTLVVIVTSALAFGLLPSRLGGDTLALVIFGAWIVSLVLDLATDLDQRVFSNLTTLPAIPIALVYALSGQDPFVGPDIVPALIAAVAIPGVLFISSIPFGAGAFGLGDVKLLAAVGLLLGGERALGGVLVGLVFAGVTLLVLLVARRIGLRSYVPYGPFLIIGALWAALVRP